MAQVSVKEYAFDFSGGHLGLDFANTVGGSRARPTERITSYQDLISWGRQAGVLNEREAQRLSQASRRRPASAARVLADAIRLREALFWTFSAAMDGHSPQPGDLEALNAALPSALMHLRLETGADGFAWVWAGDADALDRMLWPVVRSAVDLLTSPQRHRVRKCGGQNCDWLFIDNSRNHSRRWCDMKQCGNRAKARRYYERHRREDAPPQKRPRA